MKRRANLSYHVTLHANFFYIEIIYCELRIANAGAPSPRVPRESGPAVPICVMHTETKAPASRRRHAGPVLPALYALYGPDAGGALGWIGV